MERKQVLRDREKQIGKKEQAKEKEEKQKLEGERQSKSLEPGEDEAGLNMVLLIQVPLKQKKSERMDIF